MTTYRKSMSEALNQVYLGEDNMALLKKAAGGAMQTLKMKDGKVKMDSFTASAIMQVYKAINPKNKKTMENVVNTGTKSALMKLQSLAMRQIKSSYEEADAEKEPKLSSPPALSSEPTLAASKKKYDLYHKDFSSAMQHAYKMAKELHGITIDPKEIDDKVAAGPKKPSSGKTNKYRLKGDKGAIQVQVYNMDNKKYELNMYKEEVELDESKKALKAKSEKSGVSVGILSKVYDRGMAAYKTGHRPGTTPQQWALARVNSFLTGGGARKADADLWKQAKGQKEEVELTEKVDKKLANATLSMNKNQKFVKGSGDFVPKIYLSKDSLEVLKKRFGKLPREFPSPNTGMEVVSLINFALGSKDGRGPYDTEDGSSKSPKLYNNDSGKVVGKPKTVGDAVKMAGLRLESIELDEASARADAMRAMRKGKTVDPADVDTDASDDDVKSASKNIMMQLRKSVSLRGNFPVEFMDKKKVKIPQKIAQAVLNKHNSFRKPMDKEKFQAKVAKSHRDLLSALKEGLKKKEETILDRIDSKLKEKKNG